MTHVDLAMFVPLAIALVFWCRGVWKASKGDLNFSAVLFAACAAAYVAFYRLTVLTDVLWIFMLVCAAAAGGAAVVRWRRSASPRFAASFAAAALCLASLLFVGERQWLLPSNSLLVIQPYRSAGTWVFDDPRVGLKAEPFVSGIPELIDKLVADAEIPDADKGFRLTFSSQPFPGHQAVVVWRRSEGAGNWYYSPKYDMEGWLCPALFKYFKRAPKEIYVKAEALGPVPASTR